MNHWVHVQYPFQKKCEGLWQGETMEGESEGECATQSAVVDSNFH